MIKNESFKNKVGMSSIYDPTPAPDNITDSIQLSETYTSDFYRCMTFLCVEDIYTA